jgi:DNA modification methylase
MAITPFIRAFSHKGDIVLDPFLGPSANKRAKFQADRQNVRRLVMA